MEIERLVIRLENLFIEGASLEPTLLERIRRSVEHFPDTAGKDKNEVYTWWTDLNNDFVPAESELSGLYQGSEQRPGGRDDAYERIPGVQGPAD